MSFQDPPRRQRPPRYQALAPYEDGPSSFGGLADTARQVPPWDDPVQQSLWDTGSQQSLRDSGSQQSLRDSGSQQSLWDTGAQRPPRTTGWQTQARNTGAHRRAPAQETSLDLNGARADGGLPRRTSGPFTAAPEDDTGRPWGISRRGGSRGEESRRRGLLPGALVGFLAAAVALGVANLVAAFVRPQASPIIAVGEAFIDRTPPALKNFAVEKFGENDKNMLLLGMYVTIALLAITIGMLAWRRLWIGVGGIGLFGLFGAFVALTRPESHVADVIPSIIGGIAGIAAIVLLVQAGRTRPRASAAWARTRGVARHGQA